MSRGKYFCPRCDKVMIEKIYDRDDGFDAYVICRCGFRKQLWHAVIEGGRENETKATKKTS